MNKIEAGAGWHWVRQGFALFRKQPAELSALFLLYMFWMLIIGIVPVLGQLLPMMLVPVFSMAFMQACVMIERGERVMPRVLLSGFRSPALPTLLKLGMLYPLALGLAVAASSLVDDGLLWKILSGQIKVDPKSEKPPGVSLSVLFAAACYLPAWMAFWFAAPLIAWQKMGLGKALFYSFFSVARAGRAFLAYGLAWAAIGIILPSILSVMLILIVHNPAIAVLILLPVSLLLTIIMYCSFYPTYISLFGAPQEPATRPDGDAK